MLGTKASISSIPTRRMCLCCPIMKRKEIVMWIHVYPNWKMNFNTKNGYKRSFSYESKASISFIPMGRMRLCCPIRKRKEIIMWIQVYPNWKSNFNSTNGNKRCFCYETKASISLIPRGRMRSWCPIQKRKEIIMRIRVYPNQLTYINSNNGRKRWFHCQTKASISFIPSMEMCLWCPIVKRKKIIM